MTRQITGQPPVAGVPGKQVAVPAPASVAGTAGGGMAAAGLPVVMVSGPADLVNLVPWLLGFRPGEGDLVVIGTVPPRGRVKLTFRYDLPAQPDPLFTACTRRAVAALAAAGCTRVLIAGFGPDQRVAPGVALVREAAKAAGLEVGEALRAEGGRCWSYLCADASCCPPEGTGCGPAGSPVAAAFEAAGAPAPLASRAVLGAVLAPAAGKEAGAMRAAMRKAEQRAGRLIKRGTGPGRRAARSPLVTSGIRAVAAALRAYRAGGSITSCDELAWLARVLGNQVVRDEAWLHLTPPTAKPTAGCGRRWPGWPPASTRPPRRRCWRWWPGKTATAPSRTSHWTGRWPHGPATRWPACSATHSTPARPRPWPTRPPCGGRPGRP